MAEEPLVEVTNRIYFALNIPTKTNKCSSNSSKTRVSADQVSLEAVPDAEYRAEVDTKTPKVVCRRTRTRPNLVQIAAD